MNKKAVSPLIATILLIAFAVSIGAVIMNWTSSATGVEIEDSSGECSKLDIQIIEESVCISRGQKTLQMNIENGPTKIEGIRLSYTADVSDYKDFTQVIEPGIVKKITINYDPAIDGEISRARVTPLLMPSGVPVFCTEKSKSISMIPDCQ